jgi:hypothetical protein
MAQPKSLTSFWVTFDLKKISDGSTFTVRFADFDWSREDATALFSAFGEVHGGLIDVSGFKLEVGDPLPVKTGGTITINNTRGAYQNRDLRPSDLLRDYQWINAQVLVNSFKGKPDELGSSGDVRIEFVGTVKDLDFDPQSNQMRISVEPLPISTKYEMEAITADRLINTDTNTGGIGKWAPISFGSKILPAYYTYQDTEGGLFIVGTDVDGYEQSTITQFYISDPSDNYLPIVGELVNPSIGATTGTTSYRILRAPDNDAATPVTSRSWRQKFVCSNNYLLIGVKPDLKNTTAGAITYNMIVTAKIYQKRKTDNGVEFQELGSGSYEFNAETVNSGVTTSPYIEFDQPIPLKVDRRYWIEFAIAGNENQAADYEIRLIYYTESGSAVWRKEGSSSDFDRVANNQALNWLGICTENVTTSIGSEVPYYLGFQLRKWVTTADNADFYDLKILAQTSGILDGPGTITGTVNAPINDPYEVTRFLLRDQLSYLDTTTFDAANVVRTIAPRTVSGYSKGRVSNEQILSEILKETACKLVPRNDGLTTKAWALYPYGYRSSSIRYLSEQQVRLLNYKQYGRDSIVNKVDIAYGESAIPQETSALQSGQPQRFTKFKVFENGTSADFTTWTQESFTNFGTRPNNNGWAQLNWVEDDATAQFYAQYLVQSYARPKTTIDLELPFFEEDFRTIQCMDIIELSHPDMPATFGTTPDSLTPLPVYSGAVVETANYGFPFRQAQSHKLQVYSRQVIFNIGGRRAATLRLGCRVLNNPYEIY